MSRYVVRGSVEIFIATVCVVSWLTEYPLGGVGTDLSIWCAFVAARLSPPFILIGMGSDVLWDPPFPFFGGCLGTIFGGLFSGFVGYLLYAIASKM